MPKPLAFEVDSVKSMKFGYFVPIREADGTMVDDQQRTARVVIITEGLGNLRDRNYYAKTAVESCAQVFNGKQFYVDHPSRIDEENRPERSVRDLGGYFFDTSVGSLQDPETGDQLSACFASLKFAESEPGTLALAQVKAALEYQKRFPNSKDVYCGISINGGGVSHPDRVGGMPVNMVTEIKEAFSADIVTKPARGGKFLSVFQEAARVREFKKQLALGISPKDAEKRLRTTDRTVVEARIVPGGTEMKEKLQEARKAVADEAKKNMMSGEGLKGIGDKMSKLVAAINEPPADPDDLIKDIQGDLDALDSLLDDLKAAKKQTDAERKAAEQEAKMAKQEEAKRAAEDEKRGRANEDEKRENERARTNEKARANEDERHESEDEDEKREDEVPSNPKIDKRHPADDDKTTMDEDEDEYGMRSDEDENGDDDDDDGFGDDAMGKDAGNPKSVHDDSVKVRDHGAQPKAASERMAYTCASCSTENEVAPPKGFKLVKMDEQYSTESEKRAINALNTRLRRSMEAKEARFMKANADKRNLMQENITLRAKLTAFTRVVEAKRMLKEAGVPRDILSATDLIAFEPSQWPTQIKAAKRVLESESKLISRGGRGPKDSSVKAGDERGAKAAISMFQESYKK